jgi:hypothetical protein
VTAAALVETLRARGVTVRAVGGRLRLRPASAVSADEVAALKRHKPELLRLLAPVDVGDPAPALPTLDPDTVHEVLGRDPDPHVLAAVAWDVLEVVRVIQGGIRSGQLPPRRLIEGRPLADWLPLDALAALLRLGGVR